MNNCLTNFNTPQLKKVHSGKVRESFAVDDSKRLIVVTDRLSCFDKVLKTPLPHKGAILNMLSNDWFEKTRHIIDNHFIKAIDQNITLVKKAVPIRLEMIVRGYLTGSLWRQYAKGKRKFSTGITLPDGMNEYDPFPSPIVTPTTKDIVDTEISPTDIISKGIVDKKLYDEIQDKALRLFEFGSKVCKSKGIILVDTKYEFGLIDGKLVLIDEIHTPDSSRFWELSSYEQKPRIIHSLDKEFIRQWILQQDSPKQVEELPQALTNEATKRYQQIYEKLVGKPFSDNNSGSIHNRICSNLHSAGLIKEGYVAIIMGSKQDLDYAYKIREEIINYGIMPDMRVVSAHKNGEEIVKLAEVYNNSIEPGAVIAIAGRSNGLGGALAANLAIPVISSPPFKDKIDMLVNINSSLMMPSHTPAAVCIGAKNSAMVALRSLNVQRLKKLFMQDITNVKNSLKEEDKKVREENSKAILQDIITSKIERSIKEQNVKISEKECL